MALPDLPVSAALPELSAALESGGQAVLVAPPGAGKTTLVPLHLLDAPWLGDGMIVLLEPRRLAARAAARRMAELLGEKPGETVGYAMRLDRKVSARTRILVVTEGVMARMILDDPELSGISVLIFDEFHERSLDGDFGLALALDVKGGLRPDLRLLVMSATIDGARVAELLGGAPVVTSEGRSFPVDIRHDERPAGEAIEAAMARAIRTAIAEQEGSILAFLPGQREIERTAEALAGRLPANADITPLFGAMEGGAQDAAIRPAATGRRKVVLATAIAETSITIEDVRIVIDSGLARLPRYEPASGITRLETVRVSRASADQRAGRAGRTQPGVAIRLWRSEQSAALPAFTPPEILQADLTGLVLDCAAFGIADPAGLAFLDAPPAPALAEARALLTSLHAIDADGRITEAGTAMRKLALPARLAHMVAEAAKKDMALQAAELAVLLTERGLGGNDPDLEHRVTRFRSDRSPRAMAAKGLAERLARAAGGGNKPSASAGELLLHAWPDRVARARGAAGHYVLANGRGAMLDETSALARREWLVVADLQGGAKNARITAAAATSEDEIRLALGDQIESTTATSYDPQARAVRTRQTERLGAVTLGERPLPAPSGEEANTAIVDLLREHGLGLLDWSKEAATLRARLGWLYRGLGDPWPDVSDETLLSGLDTWLAPFLPGEASFARISGKIVEQALAALVPPGEHGRFGQLAPTHYDAPSGSRLPIDYEGEQPVLAIRVQELFGLHKHPMIANGTVPLTLELLSPAHRPLQTTRDLPGFWAGSWKDVRAEMRGRYPKHEWPEDPANAQATSRAKPRK
ncbi:ATP-dependent helicase HrpB [Mesorhizobium sp. Z1-4]|uniref:ATP-dependent helicase HrpB n=1 Tax=Mesorhizobium sp. Z1-4 TaxID=2448478 RepID=UPI000FD6FD2C|nr:ATP-dependent helicase HrpB [Mesorhizobium sp. Z1-4]